MTVYVDDEEYAMPVPEGASDASEVTLAGAIDAAQKSLQASGRMIIDVQFEGEQLTGDALADRQEETVGENEIRLYTADPRELAVSTLEQVRISLEESRSSLTQAASLFQEDRIGEGMAEVGTLLDTWRQSQQAVLDSTRIVKFDLNVMVFEDKPLVHLFEELSTQLKALREQLDQHDALALADTLGYEWPGVTDKWQTMLSELIQAIEKAGGES